MRRWLVTTPGVGGCGDGRLRRAATVGSSTVSVVPIPWPSLAAQRRPPCCSTIDRLIVRPSPSPPNFCPVEGPPCSNMLKIRGSTSGSMPMPSIDDLDHQPRVRHACPSSSSRLRDRMVTVPRPAG